MTNWLQGMQTGSAVALGLILGAMMAFDMGGPVNKAAYAFSVGLLASQIYEPMAAVMAAGMTPPLGLALAAVLFKTASRRKSRKPAAPRRSWASRSSPKGRSPSPRAIRSAPSRA